MCVTPAASLRRPVYGKQVDMRDFCVEQDNTPGNLVHLGRLLGDAGVNIEGLCFTIGEGVQVIHFVVEDAVTARLILENAGIKIREESEVFILHKDEKRITGKPGSFGEVCRVLADHGIKIKFGYPAENNRFVFGVDDVAKVTRSLEYPAKNPHVELQH